MLSAFPAHDFVKAVIAAAEIRAGLKTSLAFEGIQWTASKIDAIRSQVDTSAAFHVKDAPNAVQGSDNKRDCWLAAWCLLHRIYEPFAARCHALAAYGDNQDNSDLYDDGWSMGAKLCALFGAHLDEAPLEVYSAIQAEVRFELAMDAAFKVPWVPKSVTVETATLKGSIPAKGQGFGFSVIEPAQRSIFPTGDNTKPSPVTEGEADEVALAMLCNITSRALSNTNVDSWSLMPYAPLRLLAGTGDWKAAFKRDDLWTLVMSKEERDALASEQPPAAILAVMSAGRKIRAPYYALRYDTPDGPVLFGVVERGYFATKPEASIIVNDGRNLTAQIFYPGVYKTSQHEQSVTAIDTANRWIHSEAGGRGISVPLPDPQYMARHLVLSENAGWQELGEEVPMPTPQPQPEEPPMEFDALNYIAAPEGFTIHTQIKGGGEARRNTVTRRADGQPGTFVGVQVGLDLLKAGGQKRVLHVGPDVISLIYEEKPGLQPDISRRWPAGNYLWSPRRFEDGYRVTVQLEQHILDNATKVEERVEHPELEILMNGPFDLRTTAGCEAAETAMNANLTTNDLHLQKEWKWEFHPKLGFDGNCPLSLITRTDFWGGAIKDTMEIYGYLSVNRVGCVAFWAIGKRTSSTALYALDRFTMATELVVDGIPEPPIPDVAVVGIDASDPMPAPGPAPEPAPAPSPDQDVLTAYQDAEAALKRLGGLIGAS